MAAMPLNINGSVSACPYCVRFFTTNCIGCPMATADNKCWGSNEDNTWAVLVDYVDALLEENDGDVSIWYNSLTQMVELYKNYNKQFEKPKK